MKGRLVLSLDRLNVSFSLIALLAVLIIPADASNWKFREIIVGEHSPPNPNDCRLLILENADGSGTSWSLHSIHKGDEHHQGAQAVDIDDDGDLDIISVGWTHKRVLLYENRAIARPAKAQGERVEIAVDVTSDLGEVYNFWNVFPVTVQAPFLDETQHAKLRRTYRYAKYINCVRLLGGIDLKKDDYFRGVDDQGEAICDFSEGIAMLRGIRKCGFTPWIVLDNVPAAMCDNPVKNRYGNTEPPNDFRVWASYVRQFVQALVDEFGRGEVSRWRFRVVFRRLWHAAALDDFPSGHLLLNNCLRGIAGGTAGLLVIAHLTAFQSETAGYQPKPKQVADQNVLSSIAADNVSKPTSPVRRYGEHAM